MNEEVKEVVENVETKPTETVEEKPVKTFTQEELDNIVKDRLAREKKKYPSKDQLSKYNNWLESQKTEEEKTNEKITELQSKADEFESKYNNLIQESLVRKANVDEDFIEFVATKVKSLVTEQVDFEEALELYLQEHPRYLKTQEKETPIKTGTTTQRSSGVDAREKALRERMGLK